MRYDAPQRAVRIGDNSLNFAHAHLTLALAAPSTPPHASSSRTWEHIPTSHWAQSKPLSAKLTERGHSHPPSTSYNGNWKSTLLFNFPEMPLHLLWTHPMTLHTKDWVVANSLPANTTWMLSRILQTRSGYPMLAESVRDRDLGILIDGALTLTIHVNHLVGVWFFQLPQIRIICRSLTTDAAHSLVHALIHAHVDYCNEWMPGLVPEVLDWQAI